MDDITTFPAEGRWIATGVGHDELGPLLELRALGDPGRKIRARVEHTLDIVVEGPRRCIGHRPPGGHLTPCPTDEEVRGTQCAACAEAARIVPCLRCTGLRCGNPERRGECVRPKNHALYLASFGAGQVKVGVARWERRRERVLEQGARAAIVIARDDGQMVRRLEATLRQMGVADRATPNERLATLWEPRSQAELRDELLRRAEVLGRRLREPGWLETPEILELPEIDRLGDAVPHVKVRGREHLAGPVIARAGHWVVIERAGERAGIELPALVGYVLRAGGVGESEGEELQMALPLG